LRERFSPGFPINILWDAAPIWSNVKEELMVNPSDLIKEGFQQIILPHELISDDNWTHEINRRIAEHPEIIPHMIISAETVIHDPDFQLLLVPTVVVYPLQMDLADNLHNRLILKNQSKHYRINIAHKSLRLDSLGGSFYDKVNGLPDTLEAFSKSLKSQQDLSFYFRKSYGIRDHQLWPCNTISITCFNSVTLPAWRDTS
jgi:hypothetical protein